MPCHMDCLPTVCVARLSRHIGALGGRWQRRASHVTLASASAAGTPHVVIAGCGFAGISTAMHLSRRGAQVTIVDPRPPMSATSQYSTECYRNFFMDPALVPFMSRSLDIMEQLAGDENAFGLNRRGYAFLSASETGAEAFEHFAETASSYGAGPVRSHQDDCGKYVKSYPKGFRHAEMNGFDLVYGAKMIREIFPFVTDHAEVLLHARRCGWMDAQGLGQAMLQAARECEVGHTPTGSTLLERGTVAGFDLIDGNVTHVRVLRANGEELALDCDAFVNAAGAWIPAVSALLAPDTPLPLANEVHAKVILNDKLGVIPQDEAPFMVWRDSVTLTWDDDMTEGLIELDDTNEGGIVNSASWVAPQPGGQHLRPAGNGRVLLLWEHMHRHIPLPEEPHMPVEILDMYPQLCVAGLQVMVPGLSHYEGRLSRDTSVDGGYYTVTPDGRPLVDRHGAGNAFVCGGMGTYGLMGAPAAGELAALHVLGGNLPEYAHACTWPRGMPLTTKPIDLLDDSA